MSRKPYPSDVTDAEWEFLAPYLTLMSEDAPQRKHPLRELLNGVRHAAKIGCDWRSLPHDLPPWHAVYQQARRWVAAGAFEAAAHDLREILRLKEGRSAAPSAAILDGGSSGAPPRAGTARATAARSAPWAPRATSRWTPSAAPSRCP